MGASSVERELAEPDSPALHRHFTLLRLDILDFVGKPFVVLVGRRLRGLSPEDLVRVKLLGEIGLGSVKAGDEAALNRQSIILCNTDDLYVKADVHAERLAEHGVSGVVFVPTAAPDEKNRLIVEKFRRRNIPVVLADRAIEGVDLDLVTTDNREGAAAMVRFMIARGHMRIAVMLSTLYSTERRRLEGYRDALNGHGLSVDEELVMTNDDPFNDQRTLSAARALLALRGRFTAVFAGHDRIAWIIHSAAEEMGLRIPEDLSLAGYDDLTVLHPRSLHLTTMHQPIYEMGRESMKLILARLSNPSAPQARVELRSTLIERESVKTIQAGQSEPSPAAGVSPPRS